MKHIILTFLILISFFKLSAQTETKYLDYNFDECKKKKAYFEMEVTHKKDSIIKKINSISTGKTKVIYKLHKDNEDAVYAYNYDDLSNLNNEGLFVNKKKDGPWKYYKFDGLNSKIISYKMDTMVLEKYFRNELLTIEIPYKKERYHGVVNVFTKVGTIARKVTFENGYQINLEDLIVYDSLNKDSTQRLMSECMPTFIGGEAAMMRYIYEMMNYPTEAKNNAKQGTVHVKFTIDKDGKVKDAFIVSKTKIGYGCEEEAIRVIKSMPRWNPGLQSGAAVPVYFTLPIRYRLF